MKPSQTLNILPGLRWLVDVWSWLAVPMGWILTWGMMFVLMWGVEGRLPVLSQQYTGVTWGDLGLGFAYAAAILAALKYPLVVETPGVRPVPDEAWFTKPYRQSWRIAVGLIPFLALTAYELTTTIIHYGEPNVMSWNAWTSPTKLYHTGLMPVMGYLVISAASWALFRIPNTRRAWAYRAAVIVGLLTWAFFAGYYDNTFPRPDSHCVHVDDGWPWQRAEWFRGYANCPQR